MKKLAYCLLLSGIVIIAGCSKDNYDEPNSLLTGRIVYQGNPIGVRHGKVQFELYQADYELNSPITVYIASDGSFSARLFDGDYQMVAKDNNGPWLNENKSIDFTVNGDTHIEYEVTPYFMMSNVNIVLSGGIVTGVCNVMQVSGNKSAQSLALFIGNRPFVDSDSYNYLIRKNVFPVNMGGNTVTLDISEFLEENPTLYARFGVQINGIAEYIYSDVFKLK